VGDHVLLYVGAGWDMSFPLMRYNILIDALPNNNYYCRHSNGFVLSQNLRNIIQHQLEYIFPSKDDLTFTDVPSENKWIWNSKLRDCTIVYYYNRSLAFLPDPSKENSSETDEPSEEETSSSSAAPSKKSDTAVALKANERSAFEEFLMSSPVEDLIGSLPGEALKADCLWVEGLHPEGLQYCLPHLKYMQLGYHTMEWHSINSKTDRLPPAKLPGHDKRPQFLQKVCDLERILLTFKHNLDKPKSKRVKAKMEFNFDP
jgi:hypothetical protein